MLKLLKTKFNLLISSHLHFKSFRLHRVCRKISLQDQYLTTMNYKTETTSYPTLASTTKSLRPTHFSR